MSISSPNLTRLKVDGIPMSFNTMQLYNLFGKFGCLVNVIRSNLSIHVQYRTPAQAACAFSALTGGKCPGFPRALKVVYITSKLPDMVAIYNLFQDDLPAYAAYLSKVHAFKSFTPLLVKQSFVPFAVVSFSQQIDLKGFIAEIRKLSFVKREVLFEIVPNVEQTNENLIDLARTYESRTIFVCGFHEQPSYEVIRDHFQQCGNIVHLLISTKYGLNFAMIILDSAESARNCIRELNYSFVKGFSIPIHVTPYLLCNLPHRPAGMLVLNEMEPCFSTLDLYSEYEAYGELYALSVCCIAKSFVCIILFKDYSQALQAKFKSKLKNVFLFPEVDAVRAIKLFTPQRRNPDLSLVTFNNQSNGNLVLRKQFLIQGRSDSLDDFFSLKNKSMKVAVATYKKQSDLIGKSEICRKSDIDFEIIGKATYYQVFDMFTTLPIEKSWVNRIFYARGVGDNYTHSELREHFNNVAQVEAIMRLPEQKKILVLFDKPVNKNSPELLKILPNPVILEDVLNVVGSTQATRSMSQGELNAKFYPAQKILEEVNKKDPSKNDIAQERIKKMNSYEVISISTDPEKVNKFCEEISAFPECPFDLKPK